MQFVPFSARPILGKSSSVGEEVPDPSAPKEMHPNNRYDTTDYKGVWLLCRLWGRLSLQSEENRRNFASSIRTNNV